MITSILVVKLNLRDATKGQVAVTTVNDLEVDSKDIAGANVDKKMTAKAPKKKSVANVDKKLTAKAPKKKSVPLVRRWMRI